ncbi:unnamed protein product [Prorocentrum cordatum]|uniref:Uncharacterized protein n=1 Tax=Prorocentrum cordatum TaxID=2364126 RepID=A0ABN9X338_9DINO|nr:unnamed protein product [Polarella glacialis]
MARAGLKTHSYLMTFAYNIGLGEWRDQARREQVKASLQDTLATSGGPAYDAVFRHCSAVFERDRPPPNGAWTAEHAEQVYEELKQRTCWDESETRIGWHSPCSGGGGGARCARKRPCTSQVRRPVAAGSPPVAFEMPALLSGAWAERRVKGSSLAAAAAPLDDIEEVRQRARNALPEGTLEQWQLKRLLPPKCSIWNDWRRQSWSIHLAGHARDSEPWCDFGRDGAAFTLIARMWRLWLDDNDLEPAVCPVEGLLSNW